jgi:hypothetical protein
MEDKNLERLRQVTQIDPPVLGEEIVSQATGTSKPRNFLALGSVAAAALIVTAIGLGQSSPKPPLIELSAGIGTADQNSAVSRYGDNDVYFRAPDFVVTSTVSQEGTVGRVYELSVIGDSTFIANRAAKALKFSGRQAMPRSNDLAVIEGEIGPEGSALESLVAFGRGTGKWEYYNVSDNSLEDGGAENPVVVPLTDVEATLEALNIFSRTGLDVQSKDITLFRNDLGLSAMAELKVNGQVSGITWSVSWNEKGEIATASGHSVEALDRGEYNNLSPVAALKRASGTFSQSVRVSPRFSLPGDATGFGGFFRNNPITATTLTTGLVNDTKGRTWLVPSYALFSIGGSFEGAVIALEDGVIKVPEPKVIID